MAANMPYSSDSVLQVYNTGNSSIADDSVISVLAGSEELIWFASKTGISGLFREKWLEPSYDEQYPEGFFEFFPITTIAANQGSDSLLVATRGGGVGRFYRNDLDGISGASSYAKWGPCLLPSDSVNAICVRGDTQWYGTEGGLARHQGSDYMENWTAWTTKNGLVNNYVQTVAIDASGKVWVGTRGGVSVLDGEEWTSYTTRDGMISNNIKFILCDKVGDVYLGTDNGFMIYKDGNLICFQ
jgi:ligand-binding sensor domain-containing protein